MIKTRFAPSPTGCLHIGNIKIAIISWLLAKKKSGIFILRIDDTKKKEKSKSQIIKKNLKWLGIIWDINFKQSKRTKRYKYIANEIIKTGVIYPCFETKREIFKSNNIKEMVKRGNFPYWKFKLKNNKISWFDFIKGDMKFKLNEIKDPIIIRNNETFTYLLASVVDDIDYKVTDIIRGEDHVSNSIIQIYFFKSLKNNIPNLAHLPLILTSNKKKISKKNQIHTISKLRKKKICCTAIKVYLTKLGISNLFSYKHNSNFLINEFNLKKISSSNIKYYESIILNINNKIIKNNDFKSIVLFFNKENIKMNFNFYEPKWKNFKFNITNAKEIFIWIKTLDNKFIKYIKNSYTIKKALKILPVTEIKTYIYNKWSINIKKTIYKKQNLVYLRMAFTKLNKGPNLINIINTLCLKKIINILK